MAKLFSPDDIVVLKGLEAVQRRPGMYLDLKNEPIGNVLIKEALCHGIEQLMLGQATRVQVALSDDRIRIEDDGAGWPGEGTTQAERSPLELVLAELFACRRIHRMQRVQKEICRGSLAVVNAVSATMTATSWVEGRAWMVRFAEGVLLEGPTRVQAPSRQGLILDFRPSEKYLPVLAFDLPKLRAWWRDLDVPTCKEALEIV